MIEVKATPQEDLKPHLEWLGKFLGYDVYIDIRPVDKSQKTLQVAQKVFETMMDKNRQDSF